ncbi:MAG: hypothetical protein IJ814_03330 [Paludibacteraceae bacterium]|nr:hypothetical protein [Paludibacteraceae bacterium]
MMMRRHNDITKRITILLIALLASVGSYADVTYHILTLPISTTQATGKLHDWNFDATNNSADNYRYEALVCTSTSTTVDLPADFKSPLLKDAAYHYYLASDVTITALAKVYANNNTKLDLYQISASPTDKKGATVADGTHIYVVYDYDRSNATYCTEMGQNLNLNGGAKYNIQLSRDRFLAYNRTRGNRITAPKDSKTTNDNIYDRSLYFTRIKELIFQDAIVSLTNQQVSDMSGDFYFLFNFQGGDPYHIIIQTGYSTASDGWTYTQNGFKKKPDGAILYGGLVNNLWFQNEDRIQWTDGSSAIPDTVPGTFKDNAEGSKMTNMISAVALLPHPEAGKPAAWQSFANDGGEYTFVASKVNCNGQTRQPTAAGLYYNLVPNGGLNPQFKTGENYNSTLIKIGRVEHFLYKVKTPFGNWVSEPLDMTSIFGDEDPMSCIPDKLMRKYATFTGAYSDEEMTSEVTTFQEAFSACTTTETVDGVERKVIYLSYETDMPFETASADATYSDLTWYNFYTNKEPQYIVWLEDGLFKTNKHHSRILEDSHFAFIGDPFEMKIVSRFASNAAGALRYLTFAATFTDNLTYDGTGTAWEIKYDDNTGSYSDCFRMEQFANDRSGATKYLGWHYGNTDEGYPLRGSATDAARLTVIDLPSKDYVYHIMRSDGSIAAKASTTQEVSTKLDFSHIPEIIRSPFVGFPGATLSFYETEDNAKNSSSAITYAPEGDEEQHIYVRYDISGITEEPYKSYLDYIDGLHEVNVRLNGQYLYYDSETDAILSKETITDSEADAVEFLWYNGGSDPYAMTVKNKLKNKFITASASNNSALGWGDTGTPFIIKGTGTPSVYEVMLATGDEVDASATYYNIGRDATNGTRIFSNATYAHDYQQLRFQLTLKDAKNVTYHLIDKAGVDLLQVVARQATTESPVFPSDYWSPLVETYYYKTVGEATVSTIADADPESDGTYDIYVTYDTRSDYDLQNKKIMYLLKYEMGDTFNQEDGADGVNVEAQKAIYPYCNGDCNFFVYGQEQFDIQQQGAASTRTRWAWFLESDNNDPYHVKICSRQTETYNGDQARAYFHTYKPSDYSQVVTTLTWPGISSVPGTEYMVLGTVGQFRLVTTYGIDLNNDGDLLDSGENERRTVTSFEQYWKTWDTVRRKVLGDGSAVASQTDPNTVPETPAAPTAAAADKGNRTYLTDVKGWHSYEQWAYAKRWNGYNISGATAKGWEPIEHWYQTVAMGEGYFDLVPIVIDPALILLDQHGWEIMRKPLPNSADDPQLEAKHAALRVYDSPMVKEYYFWTGASKRSGFHQYYNLSRRISVDGVNYTSHSLGDLPPIDATNVKDAKGNVYDQYVTYVAKDEYARSYDPVNKKGAPFLIQQGSHYASYNGSALTKEDVPATGGMSQHILDNIANLTVDGSRNVELWYLKPNPAIDEEMGYNDAPHDNFDDAYKDATDIAGFNTNGFDPYNIRISSVHTNTDFFRTNATGATLHDGILEGTYSADPAVSMSNSAATVSVRWYDSRTLTITNKTFMAVQDESGNMQLMPRFDQTKRMKDFADLVSSSDAEIEKTHTTLYRPLVYNYHIIDNDGNESLRYQSGGDLMPQTPDWFKSRLAKDFTYYTGHTGSTGTGEITDDSSLAGAGLTTAGSAGNDVYVRYTYNADADVDKVLQGKWLTMTLNGLNAVYDSGLKQGSSKPAPVVGDDRTWQWKFLATPQTDPDPYAVSLYNRSQNGDATAVNEKTKFALLNWYDGAIDPAAYTLAVAGTGTYSYAFVNGASMTTSVAATTASEANFKSTSCSYTNTDAKIELNDDVQHTYTYKVYTNGENGSNAVKYGVEAVSATQTYYEAVDNDYVPVLPEEIQSPLLHSNQYLYYEAEAYMGDAAKELHHLYGLYEDDVYVRYTDYDILTTEYKVPNVRNATGGTVARDAASNDAALDISGELIYNIIWYTDNMMASDGTNVTDGGARALDGADDYVWQFVGDDPYALQLKHKNSGKYAVGTNTLAATATSTFMLLPASDGWQYGMLQKTGTTDKLSGYGETTVSSDPTKFIIFGLSTNTVIYHLVIANVGSSETIKYRAEKGGTLGDKTISGSTKRDLTTATYQLGETINGVNYCVNKGHITLGDSLTVPSALKRPNCKYFFYVEGIYTDGDCDRSTPSHVHALDDDYRGLQITRMGAEPELVGATVRINIEYQFDDGLSSNSGSKFVTNANSTEWYTFETNDETPYLAHYTYKANKLTAVEGQVGHYTNDFLWSPVGDPYGFVMYNRYVFKNGGQSTYVMTTASTPVADADIVMKKDDTNNPVYELLPGSASGYFKVQTLTIPGSGTPYYIENSGGTMKLKASTPTEWMFGLSNSLFAPYYQGAGNVGGLNDAGKTAYEGVEKNSSLGLAAQLMAKQDIVYNDANIVQFTPGYYRLSNEPGSSGITSPRYLSGYTHKIELTAGAGGTPIPMHFYERMGVTTTYEVLGSGFTSTPATRGAIPVTGPEYDPASIFYITGTKNAAKMQTQGLYVNGAAMTETEGSATSFYIDDLGGAVVTLRDHSDRGESAYYLNYGQGEDIYDVKFSANIGIADETKWSMEPANKTGLYIETHSGGEEATLSTLWYYATLCVPFDLMVSNKDDDPAHSSNAYTCVPSESPWSETMLHPKAIGKYTNDDAVKANYPETLRRRTTAEDEEEDNDYFVPAGTPVIFSTRRATSYVKATIPTTTPSTSISTIFSYEYLEQLLTPYVDSRRVYVFGPKMEGTLTLNESTGEITATLPSLGNTNVGFHLNANPNKEAGLTRAGWTRNNYYVLHNRIYYRAPAVAPAPKHDVWFVPVLFDDPDEEQPDETKPDGNQQPAPTDGVYDLLGRKVATGAEVLDGTWRLRLTPGIYITEGKKIFVQ